MVQAVIPGELFLETRSVLVRALWETLYENGFACPVVFSQEREAVTGRTKSFDDFKSFTKKTLHLRYVFPEKCTD